MTKTTTLAYPGAARAGVLAALLLAGLAAPAWAETPPANATAYSAIRVARAVLGAEALGRLAEVSGHDGVPQPYLWRIVLKEGPGSSKEIDVAGGKIVAQRTLPRPPASAGVIKLQALNLDSGGAFDAANAQATKVRVRFDSVNYTLRAEGPAGNPTWTMDLLNQDGAGVGTMRLTATDGTIAGINGRLAEGPGRPGQPVAAGGGANVPVPPPRTVATTTTTTVETTARPPRSVVSEQLPPPPPPVHDVDVQPLPPARDEPEGGFFTRAGRTLDHTNDTVARSLDVAHDNVTRSLDAVNATVTHSVRATGATLQHFFRGQRDDKDDE